MFWAGFFSFWVWFVLFLGKKRPSHPPNPKPPNHKQESKKTTISHHCGLSFCLMWTKGVLYDLLWNSSVIRKTSFVFNWYHVRRRVETKYEKAVNKKKSDRKRRKVSSIRQQHNLSANRAWNLDEEKRRQANRARNLVFFILVLVLVLMWVWVLMADFSCL